MTLDVLTNSRMKAARACLRYDKFRYRLGYRSARESAVLSFGTLIHRGLEAWWKAWKLSPQERLAIILAAVADEPDPFERIKAEELLAAYHYRWLGEPLDVVGVETEFIGPLVNPNNGSESPTWRRAGKLDVLVFQPSTNRHLLVEHKTSAEDIRTGSNYWVRLRIDSQVSTYHEGARFLGHQVDGCIYDVIAKPEIRPLKATPADKRRHKKDGTLYAKQRDRDETPDEYRLRLTRDIAADPDAYLQREEVVRLEREMHEAMLDDWHFAEILRTSIETDRAPRNPDACFRYGRLCEFFGVCTGAESLDDPTRFVRLDNPFTELSITTKENA